MIVDHSDEDSVVEDIAMAAIQHDAPLTSRRHQNFEPLNAENSGTELIKDPPQPKKRKRKSKKRHRDDTSSLRGSEFIESIRESELDDFL